MRAFIAVDFPETILKKLSEIISFFQSQVPDEAVKWVAPENTHLTIKFIGDLPPDRLGQVKDILQSSLEKQKAFEIAIKGLGMFPNKRAPRVIWLGISEGEPLITIHHKLDTALEKADINRDKREFSPHLTIARIRGKTDRKMTQEIGKTLSEYKIRSLGRVTIEQITLYQSDLTSTGPIYTPLLTIPLDKV